MEGGKMSKLIWGGNNGKGSLKGLIYVLFFNCICEIERRKVYIYTKCPGYLLVLMWRMLMWRR